MKKVLFITSATGIGGTEKVLHAILNLIDKNKYAVSVFSISDDCDGLKDINGIKCIHRPLIYNASQSGFQEALKISLKSKSFKVLFDSAKYFIKYHINHCEQLFVDWWYSFKNDFPQIEGEYDVAVAFGGGMTIPVALEKVRANKKILWINFDIEKFYEGYSTGLKSFYNSQIPVFDRIVTVTKSCYNSFIRQFKSSVLKEKVSIIKDVYDIDAAVEMSNESITLPSNVKRPLILTVGRLSPEKGYDMLIKAAKILKDKGLTFTWLIVGNGDQSHYQEEISLKDVKGYVQLVGAKMNPYPYYKACDFYVQTSLHEGNCLTLSEGLIFKKPCVSTDFPAAKEKIDDGINGLLTQMNPESIAQAVEKLILNEDDLREKLVVNIEVNLYSNNNELEKIYALLEDE